MELQFQKTQCPCLFRAAGNVVNEEQTQEVRLTDGMPDIGRVLGAWGQVILRSKEWRSGGMGINGGIMVWMLYAPEDGSDERCMEAWIPFQSRLSFPDTDRDGVMRVSCMLSGVDARSVSPRKLMVRCGLSIFAEALVPGEADIYDASEVPEDVQLLRRSYPMELMTEAGEKPFEMEEILSLPSTAPGIGKLLRFELRPELIDQKVVADKVVFRGAATVHVLYRGTDGLIRSWDFEVPFSQYTTLDQDYDSDASARIMMAVTGLEMDLQEDGNLHMKAGLTGQYVICRRKLLQVVEDAYSPRRSVMPTVESLKIPSVLDQMSQTVRTELNQSAEGTQLADIAFYPEHPRQRRGEDAAELILPGTFQILSYDSDGNLHGAVLREENTMQLPVGEDARLDAMCCPSGRPGGAFTGNEVNLRGDTLMDSWVTAACGIPMVTALELGELKEKDPARPSLILRRLGDDDLWSVAKRCGSTVDAIRSANHIDEEPGRDRVLLIPVS